MKRETIIALLKQHGLKVADGASDESLLEELSRLIGLRNKLNALAQELTAARTARIEAIVNALVAEARVTAEEAPKAIARAVADESYLDELRARLQSRPTFPQDRQPTGG